MTDSDSDAKRCFRLDISCMFQHLLTIVLIQFAVTSVHAEKIADRRIEHLVASRYGSNVVAAINDDGASQQSRVVFMSPSTGQIVWQRAQPFTIGSVAISPDGNTVAVGLVGVPDRDLGVVLIDAHTGKQVGGLGVDLNLSFMPGITYPRFGSGVSQLKYSPDGALLYGLSNDTLFAWDVAAKKYLWITDIPAVIEAPPDLPDPLPYGHATDFTLSPDGRQIAALRDTLRIATAGRTKPPHFIERSPTHDTIVETVVFSSDNRVLAAGEYGTLKNGKAVSYATDLWIDAATKAVHINGCGGGIAWTGQTDMFGCQNDSGSHLHNIFNPHKDIGAAAPSGDLPILKIGNSLWSCGYKRSDWTDPTKPLALTLVELGSGKRVSIILPGRPQPASSAR
jgi:WD40 repeat protein